MVVTVDNVKEYMEAGGFIMSPVYPITKWRHFRIRQNISVLLTNGDIIKIPKGFEFDGSSSPRLLWSLFPTYGDFLFAALIHDFLYKTDYKREDLGDSIAKLFADNEMYVWSEVLNKNHIGNKLRYDAVRLFGKKVFKK